MNKIFVLCLKELNEHFIHNKRIIISFLILIFAFSPIVFGISSQNNPIVLRIIALIFSLLPVQLGIIFALPVMIESFYREKINGSIEYMLGYNLSLKELWLGKTLGLTMGSYLISVLLIIIFNIALLYKSNILLLQFFGFFAYLNLLILSPIALFSVIGFFSMLYMLFRNYQIPHYILFALVFSSFFLISKLKPRSPMVFEIILICGIAILITVSFIIAHFITRERVILSTD